jgi:hypothetical protein
MLIGHWPLNGNTNDISTYGNNGVPTNVTYTTGKIGQAASFNSGRIDVKSNGFGSFNFQEFSISAWVRYDGSTGDRIIWAYDFTSHVQPYYSQHLRFSHNNIILAWNDGAQFRAIIHSIAMPANTWTHITGTFKFGEQKLYVNGILVQSSTRQDVITYYNTPVQIGAANYTTGTTFLGNDIRVFNHALTDIEIQEIARANILHYSFDDFQEPTTNYGRMLETVSLASGLSSSWSIQKLDRDTVKVTALINNPSFATFGDITTTLTGTRFIPAGSPVTLSCEIVDFKGSLDRIYPASGGFGTLIGNAGSFSQGPAGIYLGRRFRTITHTSNWTHNIIIRISGAANILAGDYLTIRLTQIEEKAYPTEYVHTSRIGQVNDYSGFFNHSNALTEATTPRWIPEAKIGTGAYRFFGESGNRFIDFPFTSVNDYPFTISAWIKTFSTNRQIAVSLNRDTTTYWSIGTNEGKPSTEVRPAQFISVGTTTITNQWVHLTGVFTSTNVKMFLNGSLEFENSNIADISNPPNKLMIGRQRDIAIGTGHGPLLFDGEIDDVRIYTTVLSDKDILDLYNTKAEIEQSGVLYARDFLSNAEETVNLLSGQTISFSALTVNISTQNLGEGRYRVTSTSFISPFTFGTIRLNLPAGILINGLTYNVSLKYRIISGSSPSFSTSDWCDQPVTREAINFAEYTLETAFGSRSTYDNTFKFMDYNFSANTVIEIWDIQLEQRAGRTSYISTFRPAIELPSTLDFAGDEVHETGTANFEDFSTVGITDGLIAYYPLRDNGNDYSGNNFNGTVNNLSSTSGKDGSTFNFDGVLGNGIFTNNFPLRNVSEFTISLWLYNTTVASARGICGQDDCVEFAIHTSGTILLYTNGHTNLSWTWDTAAYPLNEWHHVVVTNKANLKVLYMDGTQVASVASGGLTVNTGFPFTIGDKVLNQSDSGIIGKMQDIKVFNRALTAEEIMIEYNTMFNNEVQIHESGVLYAKDIVQY